jgi:hypothetical protein
MHFPSPRVVRTTGEFEAARGGKPVDWVVLALKSTSLEEVGRWLTDFGARIISVGRHTLGWSVIGVVRVLHTSARSD